MEISNILIMAVLKLHGITYQRIIRNNKSIVFVIDNDKEIAAELLKKHFAGGLQIKSNDLINEFDNLKALLKYV